MTLRFDSHAAMVAVPVMGTALADVRRQWSEAARSGADLIEWRLDYIAAAPEDEAPAPTLTDLAAVGREMSVMYRLPVLATYRTTAEGGRFPSGDVLGYRDAVVSAASWADAVDVEYAMAQEIDDATALILESESGQLRQTFGDFVRSLKATATVVVSVHDFGGPMAMDDIVARLSDIAAMGADVAKVACTVPDTAALYDVLTAQRWAAQNLPIPAVVIGMGSAGQASRLGESALTSAFTFARGVQASAPGQPTVEEIRASISGQRLPDGWGSLG